MGWPFLPKNIEEVSFYHGNETKLGSIHDVWPRIRILPWRYLCHCVFFVVSLVHMWHLFLLIADSLLISKATKDTCKDSFELSDEHVCNFSNFSKCDLTGFHPSKPVSTASLWTTLTLMWLCSDLVGMIGMIHTFTTFIYDTYIYDISFMIYDTYIHLGYICIQVFSIHIPSISSPRFARSSWRAAAEWNSLVSWASIRRVEINWPR